MDLHQVRKFASRLEFKVFKKANSNFEGIIKSKFKGQGLQFREHKQYVNGDEVRHIDWKLSARSQSVFIKTFEEERNIEFCCLIELNSTGTLGYNSISKNQAVIEICCLLYLIAHKNNDLMTVRLLFNNEIFSISKSSGEKGIYRLLKVLERLNIVDEQGRVNRSFSLFKNDKQDQDLRPSFLKRLNMGMKKMPYIILSDFNGEISVSKIKDLAKRVQVIPFHVFSDIEEGISSNHTFFSKINFFSHALDARKRKDEFIANRIRPLRVDENYLQSFYEGLRL